jgi:hypothetical protein
LILPVLGFFAGVISGDLTGVESWIYHVIKIAVPIGSPLIFLTYLWFKRRYLPSEVCAVVAFFWGLVHNPPPVPLGEQVGRIVWTSGCSLQDDDLLVEANGWVYRAKGRGAVDTRVALYGKNLMRFVLDDWRQPLPRSRSTWCQVGMLVRSQVHARIKTLEPDVAGWLRAFVLGEQFGVAPAILEGFRAVGLLHLLVLSGGHLSVIATVVLVAIRLPWHIFYIRGQLPALQWLRVTSFAQPLTLLVLFIYCAATGFSQSMQRAALCFGVSMIPPMLGLSMPTQSRILLAIILQAIFFPGNFLSFSMLMSWCGVLLLTAFVESTFLKSYWGIFSDAVLVQATFFIFSLLFFGQVGILAIPANLIFQLIFSMLLPFDLIALALPPMVSNGSLSAINRLVLGWIERLAVIQGALPLPVITVPQSVTVTHPGGRVLVPILMVGLFLMIGCRQKSDEKTQV